MNQEIKRIDLQGVNCYLVKTSEGFILFDTGGPIVMDKTFTDRCQELDNELEKAGCRRGNLKLVVLTHGDFDHVGNVVYLRKKYQTKIAMHQGDLELVDHPEFEKVMGTYNYRHWVLKLIFRIFKTAIEKTTRRILEGLQSFQPDLYLSEGDSLQEYGFEGTVLHIPGHTAGSIAILSGSGDLICGDTFANIHKPVSALNAYDFKSLDISVARLKAMPLQTVYPGHGAPFARNELR